MKRTVFVAFAALTAFSAVAASAADYRYFDNQNSVGAASNASIDYISMPANGTIALYDYTGNTEGTLIGTEVLQKGVTQNLDLNDLGLIPGSKVLAVLSVDGEVIGQNAYSVNGF